MIGLPPSELDVSVCSFSAAWGNVNLVILSLQTPLFPGERLQKIVCVNSPGEGVEPRYRWCGPVRQDFATQHPIGELELSRTRLTVLILIIFLVSIFCTIEFYTKLGHAKPYLLSVSSQIFLQACYPWANASQWTQCLPDRLGNKRLQLVTLPA